MLGNPLTLKWKEVCSGACAKIQGRWSIEGEENSKYIQELLIKRRSQLAIRGILVDGIGHSDPLSSREEFSFKDFPNHFLLLIFSEAAHCGLVCKTFLLSSGLFPRMPIWCKWIKEGLIMRRLVLVNGSPTSEFQFFKGLKQGDPLSPFLFILVMETLHLSFMRICNAGLYKVFSISNSHGSLPLVLMLMMLYSWDWNDRNVVETKFEFFTLIEIVLFGTCNTLFEDVKADDPDVLLGVGVESDVNVSFRGLPLGLGVNDIVLFCTCKPASGDVEIDGLCASLCAVLEWLTFSFENFS
ncbi:hypothetical protein Tco_0796405 [Tanacetum coccineum]